MIRFIDQRSNLSAFEAETEKGARTGMFRAVGANKDIRSSRLTQYSSHGFAEAAGLII